MNKDDLIAEFDAAGSGFGSNMYFFDVRYIVTDICCDRLERLPYNDHSAGKRDSLSQEELKLVVGRWLSERCGANHNFRVSALFSIFDIDELSAFIKETHAASLNDTFWVKSADEEISWADVSLYRKDYDENISRFCLGEKIQWDEENKADLSAAPELVTNGSFHRGFDKYGNDILFYKRSSDMGMEAYCEVMASEIAELIAPGVTVRYSLVDKWDKKLSECRFFTDEQTGFVPYYCFNIKQRPEMDEILAFFERIGGEDLFRRMQVLDALTFNTDRHLNNFGILMDNDTLKLNGMAPIFDLNLSLFGDMQDASFDDFYSAATSHRPCIGQDFIQIGRNMMTDSIRDAVKNVADFSFSFRGDDVFKPWRVEKIERIVREQAKALLSEEEITVRQLYVNWKSEKTKEDEKKYEMIVSLAHDFVSELETAIQKTSYKDYDISIMEDAELRSAEVYIDDPDGKGTVTLSFIGHSITQTGRQFPEDLISRICDIYERYR